MEVAEFVRVGTESLFNFCSGLFKFEGSRATETTEDAEGTERRTATERPADTNLTNYH